MPASRTTVLRNAPGDLAWELWLRTPAPGLTDLVAGLWAGDADATSASHRLLPNGELWVMFNLGPPQRVITDDAGAEGEIYRAALISGLQGRPLRFDSVVRHPRVVCVRLAPLGAWAFFGGLPLDDLADQVIDLEAVLGRAAGTERLRHELMETSDLGAALDRVETWLWERIGAGPTAHPVTRAAITLLGRLDARVDGVAHELGVSARHLHGLLRRQVGVSAKRIARLFRFERAQECLADAPTSHLGAVALDCGYYDQPHLNREFRELAGLTPAEYRARVFRAPGWREIRG